MSHDLQMPVSAGTTLSRAPVMDPEHEDPDVGQPISDPTAGAEIPGDRPAGLEVVAGWRRRRRARHRRRPPVARVTASLLAAAADLGAQTGLRLRLLIGSAVGVSCLLVAHFAEPDRHELFALPTSATAWLLLVCGAVGTWLTPGLWLTAIVARADGGQAAWLATRIATGLIWYVLLGPLMHHFGRGAQVTTTGLLVATVAATAAVSLGVALGLCRRPRGVLIRLCAAAAIGAAVAQCVLVITMRVWSYDMNYEHIRRLQWLIVLGSAALVAVGVFARPALMPAPAPVRVRALLAALAVTAVCAALLVAASSAWSPAQRMASALGFSQTSAPPGSDVAFTVSAMGPAGPALLTDPGIVVADDTGHPVPATARWLHAAQDPGTATLLISLDPQSRVLLCPAPTPGEESARPDPASRLPVKLNVGDPSLGLRTQAVLPAKWCGR